jgi:hypothetical protein
MSVSAERTAELVALLEVTPKPRGRPVLVCRDGRIVDDAVVVVSPRDPNWYRRHFSGFDGKIHVRTPPPVLRRRI